MRRCLRDDGRTSSRSAGSLRSTITPHAGRVSRVPRLRDGRLRRQQRVLCRDSGLNAVLLNTTTSSFPSSPPSSRLRSSSGSSADCPDVDSLAVGSSSPGCDLIQSGSGNAGQRSQGAAVVNRELLDWLSRRHQPERPFFAFLNYFDAHHPYLLPTGRMHRFGFEPDESPPAPARRMVHECQDWSITAGNRVRDRLVRRLHRRPRRAARNVARRARAARHSQADMADCHLGPR